MLARIVRRNERTIGNFIIQILRIEEPLLLDNAGEDEADIRVSFASPDGTRERLTFINSSPLRFIESLQELFSKNRTSFWLGSGLYIPRLEFSLIPANRLRMCVELPSLLMADYDAKSNSERLEAILQEFLDLAVERGRRDGLLADSVPIDFYRRQIRDFIGGVLIDPPPTVGSLAFEIPSIEAILDPDEYVSAVTGLAEDFFSRVTPEGELKEAYSYKRYLKGVSSYESWKGGKDESG